MLLPKWLTRYKTSTYAMARDVTGVFPDWRHCHAALGLHDHRIDHRNSDHRHHRADRLPEDPANTGQDQRPLGAGRAGNAGGHGAGRGDPARLSERAALHRVAVHRLGDDGMPDEGGYGVRSAEPHHAVQRDALRLARLGAIRSAWAEHGLLQLEHRRSAHRKQFVESGLGDDQPDRQGGAAMKREQGFTIVEVIVAILVLTIGLLALVTSAALVTRMIGRGQRSAVAAQYAQRRLEMLRASGCNSQAGGTEGLMRGATPVDSITWRFANTSPKHWQIVVRSTYPTALGKWRTDSTETQISCLF